MRLRELHIVIAVGGVGAFSGCAGAPQGRVTALDSGGYEVVAVGSSERGTQADGRELARLQCKKSGLEPEMTHEESYFRGMNREARAGMAVAGALLGNMVGTYRASAAGRTVRGTSARDEDYRFVMKFICAKPKVKKKKSFLDDIF